MASGDEEFKHTFSADKNACNEMQTALLAIANEINRLNDSTSSLDTDGNTNYHECIFNKLIQCKSKLISKKRIILKLKENIRIACFVAKTIMTAKRNEVASLHVNLKIANNQIDNFTDRDKNQNKQINYLTIEINTLRDELENLKKIINNGYLQLQKYRGIPSEEHLPSIVKLKHILINYNHIAADYCDIHQKYEQTLQRNRFLNNKLNIMSYNIDVTTSELWNLRNQIIRLKQENSFLRSKTMTGQVKSGNLSFTGYFKTSQSENIKLTNAKFDTDTMRHIDLGSHLNLVKELLNDQHVTLQELTWLSQGVKCDSCQLLD